MLIFVNKYLPMDKWVIGWLAVAMPFLHFFLHFVSFYQLLSSFIHQKAKKGMIFAFFTTHLYIYTYECAKTTFYLVLTWAKNLATCPFRSAP